MISVVIPAFNEAGAIEACIADIKKTLDTLSLAGSEIIVVDDGSSDDTALKAEGSGAVVVRNPHNIGYGFSIKRGLHAAKHDTVIIMDSDSTYRAEDIPKLLDEYSAGFDMVVGARQGKHYRESILKMLMRSILKWIVEFTTGTKVPDVNSGMRVFSRGAVLEFEDHLCNTFSFTTTLTIAFIMSHKFVSHVPISYDGRVGATKVRHVRDALRTVQYIVESLLYFNPIKLFLSLSMLALLGSCAAAVAAVFLQPGAVILILVTGVIGALIVFSIGLVAASLGNRDRK